MPNIIKVIIRWKEVILITISVRILLILLSLIMYPNFVEALNSWVRWDAPHYLDIAKYGYQTSGTEALWIVFFPLYPLLVKITSFLIPNFTLAAIFLSIFFSLVAAIGLFELTLLDFNKRAAFLSVWFLNIFPTAYFLQAPYTESLYLTTSILTVYFFRKNLFLFSSASGFLTGLTRINGLTLLVLLFVEKRISFKNLSTFLLIIMGFIIYLVINFLLFHDPLYFTHPLQSNWYKKIDWPWIGIINSIHHIPEITHPDFYIYFSEVIAIVTVFSLGLLTFLKIRKSYGIYVLVNLMLIISTHFILSTPRYALTLFPLFIYLGTISNKGLIFIISISFISLLILFSVLYLKGAWAF